MRNISPSIGILTKLTTKSVVLIPVNTLWTANKDYFSILAPQAAPHVAQSQLPAAGLFIKAYII